MATCIDITDKLSQEVKSIKLGGNEYPVDDSKNTMIAVMAALEQTDGKTGLDLMADCMALMLGADAVKDIDALRVNGKPLTLESYQTVFTAVMAAATNTTMEEAQARFRNAAKE